MPGISSERPFATEADVRACRAALKHGSKSFYMASLLLPRRVREPAGVIYAFCRQADDTVDVERSPLAAVDTLRERLLSAARERPQNTPLDRALADVLARHAIPVAIPEALLEGLAWDVEGRRYADRSGAYAYATRVAGTVGAMMALLMGARSAELVSRAVTLGIAMQFTNIARDVGEDARAGRIYLPLQWLVEEGVDPEAFLRSPVYTSSIARVVRRLTNEADRLYDEGRTGIDGLPADCRPGIHAARLLYGEIGRRIHRDGVDPVRHRSVVPRGRKFALLSRAVCDSVLAAAPVPVSNIPEASFLVDAVLATPAPETPDRTPKLAALDERAGWVVDLYSRLEARDRNGRPLRAEQGA
ncbi:MAG: phytoene/squalene synthase family protein [Hyphomicrobiales bacterium]